MKANVGGVDKALRMVIGIGLPSLLLVLKDEARRWGLIGPVLLLTGLFGYCPLYRVLGLSTCPVAREEV